MIFLRSPTGQQITLFDREGATPDPFYNFGSYLLDSGLEWTFAADSFRGMSALGTWRVMVHDRAAGDTGVITDARLDFYGSANTINDVYSFTDDFAMLRNLQTGRRVIDDTNGGVDWLNFVAVSGTLSVNMVAGGAIRGTAPRWPRGNGFRTAASGRWGRCTDGECAGQYDLWRPGQ